MAIPETKANDIVHRIESLPVGTSENSLVARRIKMDIDALKRVPGEIAGAYAAEGMLYTTLRNIEKAFYAFDNAMRLDQQDDCVIVNYVHACLRWGDIDKAIEVLSKQPLQVKYSTEYTLSWLFSFHAKGDCKSFFDIWKNQYSSDQASPSDIELLMEHEMALVDHFMLENKVPPSDYSKIMGHAQTLMKAKRVALANVRYDTHDFHGSPYLYVAHEVIAGVDEVVRLSNDLDELIATDETIIEWDKVIVAFRGIEMTEEVVG